MHACLLELAMLIYQIFYFCLILYSYFVFNINTNIKIISTF